MSRKILIVEDDLNLSSVLENAFKRNDFEVTVTHDGEEAFQALTKNNIRPDVVLLDILMPKLDGFGFMDKLRSLDTDDFRTIPVIVLTSLSQKADYEKMMTKGTVDYLVKSSYEPAQIVDKVKEMLQRFGA